MTEQVPKTQEQSPKLSDETVARYMAVFGAVLNPGIDESPAVARERNGTLTVEEANASLDQYFSSEYKTMFLNSMDDLPPIARESFLSGNPVISGVTVRAAFSNMYGLSVDRRRKLMVHDPLLRADRVIEVRRYYHELVDNKTYAGCDVLALSLNSDKTATIAAGIEYGSCSGFVDRAFQTLGFDEKSEPPSEEQVNRFIDVVSRIMDPEPADAA